ncbi:MAG TPA: hypothetical protein VK420_06360, partial [Longimicrobium sp.]|nr:hypothetical protein [Longimicrobium sp.]
MLALSGCATVGIQPAPDATMVAGDTNAAFAVASDVRVTVRTDAWQGGPADLERVLTPLEVTIENNSGQPVRVRYQDFGLVGEGGFRYAAIPPFATEQAKQSKVVPKAPEPGRFVLAMAEGGVHAATPVPAPPPPSGPPPSAGMGPVPLHEMTPLSRPPPAMTPPVQTAPRQQAERFITPGATAPQLGGMHSATPVRPRDPVVITRPRFY